MAPPTRSLSHAVRQIVLPRNLPSILVGLALLVWLLIQVDLGAILELLRQARPEWVVLGGGLYLLSNLSRAYRFVRLNQLPLRQIKGMYVVVLAMSLANHILPARLGELSYVYLARKSQDLPVGRGLASLLIARLFDLFCIGLIFVVGASAALDELPSETSSYIGAATVGMLLVAAAIASLVIWRRPMCRWAQNRLSKPPLSRVRGRERLARLIDEVEAGLSTLRRPIQYLDILQSSLVVWISNFVIFYVLLIGLGLHITAGKTAIGVTFAALSSILPINSIGSFGTQEAGWTAGFILVGMESDLALATGFATHLLTLAYAVVFGLLAWGWVLWWSPSRRRVTSDSDG